MWAVVYLRLSSGGEEAVVKTPLSRSLPPSWLGWLYTRFHQFHYRPLLNNKPDLTHSPLSRPSLCVCVQQQQQKVEKRVWTPPPPPKRENTTGGGIEKNKRNWSVVVSCSVCAQCSRELVDVSS